MMNISFRHIILSLTAVAGVTPLFAITPEEVSKAVAQAKEAPKNQKLNLAAGNALKEARRFKEAVTYYLKGGNSGNLGAAESYFYLYDYDNAEEYLDKYLEKRTKAEEAKDKEFSAGGEDGGDWTDFLRGRIELGRSMLDRVEKIQIVDSINVPADEFYKFIKLGKSAGRLSDEMQIENTVSSDMLRQLEVSSLWAPAYISESGDDMIWYGSTDNGDSKMFESIRLADGSWDKPVELFDYSLVFGDSNGSWVSYPFLMSDGVTLYFAADGDSSLGELDIFISRRDSDGFLQPSNIGMPYNSPYNDYLYAVDEENGIGWWATDRNQLQDSVTIYTFIPQDLRINYPVDEPNLTDYAKVTSIVMTQTGETDYDAIRAKISDIGTGQNARKDDGFVFVLPDGKTITSFSQLSLPSSIDAMKSYLRGLEQYNKRKAELAKMRIAYGKGDKSLTEKILSAEQQLENSKADLLRLKNAVISQEYNRKSQHR
ncbi:MAG: hypothetical protein NC212_09680 [Staphylococcus sp.]|nr:hypothetical protein [Staphylococcus sp.]